MTEISVIIPVYNVRPWLCECLDSILAQTFSDIEIIVVDDGSDDGSGEICDAYAVKDRRITVIHRENGGLSAARNTGIKAASGRYLMFLDSDDYVDPRFCEIPYRLAEEHHADIVSFRFYRFKDGEPDSLKADPLPEEEKLVSFHEAMTEYYRYITVGTWSKLYASHLFQEISFPEGRYFEDIDTTWRLFHKANVIYVSRSLLYYYRSRRGSIVSSTKRKVLYDHVCMQKRRLEGLEKLLSNDELKTFRRHFLKAALRYFIFVRPDTKDEYYADVDRWIRESQDDAQLLTRKSRLVLSLYLHKPALFSLLFTLRGRQKPYTKR